MTRPPAAERLRRPDLLAFRCEFCGTAIDTMSAVPQGAFAAHKVRQNEEKLKMTEYNADLSPQKYSSKFMNSVWGLYNRYSVHNFKKNLDQSIRSSQQLEFVGQTKFVE